MIKQITDTIIMIRPVRFRYNEETASNNYYQKHLVGLSNDDIQHGALEEFNNFVKKLEKAGVNVIIFDDIKEANTPDSIFPNNWISFHNNGVVTLYPMYAENRRKERRRDIINSLSNDFSFRINEIKDFSCFEKDNKFLEGTGSMVLDRTHKICYAAISVRTDTGLVNKFCNNFDYTPICFEAKQNVNGHRMPIYHTNVMMCVADQFVIICLDSIDDKLHRDNVSKSIIDSGKEIIEITEDQKNKFAGNMLQVMGNKTYLVMSNSAYDTLLDKQIRKIENYCSIIYSSLDIIEACGGGSARCMMAEVFLTKK